MKIYDCFIVGSELDILELRLAYLYNTVDFFVLVESNQTLAGNPKPLFYQENKTRFKKFSDKIIHVIAPNMPGYGAWEYEYFQRNYIKQGLINCADEDIILISDVDEIVNLPEILKIKNLKLPVLIDLPFYYYFFNLKSRGSFMVNLLANYGFIKNMPLGRRIPDYNDHVKNYIPHHLVNTGWHFSYLFGFDIKRYQEKLQSFAHQEFNTAYYLNPARIKQCVTFGIDLNNNYKNLLTFKRKTSKDIALILPFIYELNFTHYLYNPKLKDYLNFKVIGLIIKRKIIPKLIAPFNYRYIISKILVPTWHRYKYKDSFK